VASPGRSPGGRLRGLSACARAFPTRTYQYPRLPTPQITGGRNGYGAKLANIFSTKFVVETCDGRRQRRFLQTFSNNMGTKSTPKITACKPSDNWTCITFEPDLAKFDMTVSDWHCVLTRGMLRVCSVFPGMRKIRGHAVHWVQGRLACVWGQGAGVGVCQAGKCTGQISSCWDVMGWLAWNLP
jgi:hypothetical protein